MNTLLECRPEELDNDAASGVGRLLRDAFPDDGPQVGDYYRTLGAPEIAIVLRDEVEVFGHLGLYTREVEIGCGPATIGMLGGIVVAPDHRRQGHCRVLLQRAHAYLRERKIPFSVLFAYEPAIYESSGYRLMRNPTRFIEPDGTPRTLVYRGSMYAELSRRRWPNELLDLRGRTI